MSVIRSILPLGVLLLSATALYSADAEEDIRERAIQEIAEDFFVPELGGQPQVGEEEPFVVPAAVVPQPQGDMNLRRRLFSQAEFGLFPRGLKRPKVQRRGD